MHYYVYYKLKPEQVDAARRVAETVFAEARQAFGVQPRLQRRRDDPSTYMEIYEGLGEGAAFEALLARHPLPDGVQRHVERFVDA